MSLHAAIGRYAFYKLITTEMLRSNYRAREDPQSPNRATTRRVYQRKTKGGLALTRKARHHLTFTIKAIYTLLCKSIRDQTF